MNETSFGEMWDISYDPETGDDVILIEGENGTVMYLSVSDLEEMLGAVTTI